MGADTVGRCVGAGVGAVEGTGLGEDSLKTVGPLEGSGLGTATALGMIMGADEGLGGLVGWADGETVATAVGALDGATVGKAIGAGVGTDVGALVGAAVGA